MSDKEIIARRVARELRDGDVVNLGIGLPTLVANYVPGDVHIWLQSENGCVGMGPAPREGEFDGDLVNAGGMPITVTPGACFFDSAMSFSIIRGGHVDVTVLGALEVDETGSLASHIVPGKRVSGMGGAMDLVVGSRRVIVATTHTTKDGAPKIVRRLSLPVTAVGRVHRIVTERAVIDVTERGLVVRELAEGQTLEGVRAATGADLMAADRIERML